MKTKISQPWIQLETIDSLIHIEPFLLIIALSILAAVFYKLFLRSTTPDRHRSIRSYLKNLAKHLLFFLNLYFAYEIFSYTNLLGSLEPHVLPYVGLVTVIWGCITLLKAARLLIFEYLFLSHKETGVPVLIVNLATLLIAIILTFWLLNSMFGLQLTPLVATSAAFSLIFGLALQDTLGNLFAGIAVQMDKPYEIGHWIEVQGQNNKWIGQVHEITWRATVLIGWSDEIITIPNRVIAQAQISNYSITRRPIIRTHTLNFEPNQNYEKIKTLLLDAVHNVDGVKKYPEPGLIIREVTDANMILRLYYYISDYGSQYSIGDKVLENIIDRMKSHKIGFARPKLDVTTHKEA